MVNTASLQPFDLLAIGRLQRAKYSNVARLKLVRRMRGQTAQDDAVCKTVL